MKLTDEIEMIHGDCMEYMKRCKDNVFDLAIVDPPYGINITKHPMGSRNTVKPDKSKSWDSAIPNDEYFKELKRVSKNQLIWGGELLWFIMAEFRFCCMGQGGNNVWA